MRVSTGSVAAVVLAGGMNQTPLFEGNTPGYTALLPLGGRQAIHYTLDALRATPAVNRCAIVGPVDELRAALGSDHPDGCDLLPGGATLMEDIFQGLKHFSDAQMVLIITADLPLITSEAISDFLAACGRKEATDPENMFLSVVPAHSYHGPYADYPQTFNRFKDISICYGNLFLVDPTLLANHQAIRRMNALYNARKNPLSTAIAFGLHLGLTYVLGVHMWHLLTLEHMARIASQRFGLGLIPVILDHPEAAINLDEPADYAFVTQQLGSAGA